MDFRGWSSNKIFIQAHVKSEGKDILSGFRSGPGNGLISTKKSLGEALLKKKKNILKVGNNISDK
jgi:hypothetical protein